MAAEKKGKATQINNKNIYFRIPDIRIRRSGFRNAGWGAKLPSGDPGSGIGDRTEILEKNNTHQRCLMIFIHALTEFGNPDSGIRSPGNAGSRELWNKTKKNHDFHIFSHNS